jgi:hypothetical protein
MALDSGGGRGSLAGDASAFEHSLSPQFLPS